MQASSPKKTATFFSSTSFPAITKRLNITVVGINYYQSTFDQKLFCSLKIPFPNSLNKAVIKQKSEFLAGRYVAIKALSILGFNISDVPIGKYREPIWPHGVIGSISHTDTSAFCTVAFKKM